MSEVFCKMDISNFRFSDFFPNNQCSKLWLGSLTTLWPCVGKIIKKFVEITCSDEERDFIIKFNRHPRKYMIEDKPISSTVAQGLTAALKLYQDQCGAIKSDRERLEVFCTPILEATRQVEVMKGFNDGHLREPLKQYVLDFVDTRG